MVDRTVAELRSAPIEVGLAMTVIVSVAPLAIESRSHVSEWRIEHEPLPVWPETSFTDFENASVTVGLAAVAGPWLVTVIV